MAIERALLIGSFQRERFYRQSEARWRDLFASADTAFVFADFQQLAAPRVETQLRLSSSITARLLASLRESLNREGTGNPKTMTITSMTIATGEKEYADRGGRHVHFAFSVGADGLEALCAQLRAGGVEVEGPVEHEGGDRSLYFSDPAGSRVELWAFFRDGDGAEEGVTALTEGEDGA